MPPNTPRLPPEAAAAIARGELILAIKIVREAGGLGLREAKEAVEAYAASARTGEKLQHALAAKADAANLVLPQSVIEALAHGQLIDAIKRLREANPQLGLKEAKDALDAIASKHPAGGAARQPMRRVPTVVQGDRGHGGWVWLILALVAVAVWVWMAGRG